MKRCGVFAIVGVNAIDRLRWGKKKSVCGVEIKKYVGHTGIIKKRII